MRRLTLAGTACLSLFTPATGFAAGATELDALRNDIAELKRTALTAEERQQLVDLEYFRCDVVTKINEIIAQVEAQRQVLTAAKAAEIAPVATLQPCRDAAGRPLPVDPTAQALAEHEVRRVFREHHPMLMLVLVSDAASGRILAAAQGGWPDHTVTVGSFLLEPGAMFLPLTWAAALDNHLITADAEFDTSLAEMEYAGRTVELPATSCARMDVRSAFREGSDAVAARLGLQVMAAKGDAAFRDFAATCGYGKPTGCGIAGEAAGMLTPMTDWTDSTRAMIPCGRAFVATPLQAHAATAILASGGLYRRPSFGTTPSGGAPVRMVSEDTAQTLRGLMLETFRRNVPLLPVTETEMAGIAGTVPKIIAGSYSSTAQVCSFTGFAPASAPKYVITVVIDEPRHAIGPAPQRMDRRRPGRPSPRRNPARPVTDTPLGQPKGDANICPRDFADRAESGQSRAAPHLIPMQTRHAQPAHTPTKPRRSCDQTRPPFQTN